MLNIYTYFNSSAIILRWEYFFKDFHYINDSQLLKITEVIFSYKMANIWLLKEVILSLLFKCLIIIHT